MRIVFCKTLCSFSVAFCIHYKDKFYDLFLEVMVEPMNRHSHTPVEHYVQDTVLHTIHYLETHL